MFDNLREDWRTYERDIWRQGLWVMVAYRFGRWRYGVPRYLRPPFSFLYKLMKIASQILTGIDLPCEVTLGRRVRIEHFGDIIISGDTVIGDDVVLRNGVTIGLRHTGTRGAPGSATASTSGQEPRSWGRSPSATIRPSARMRSC